LNHQSGVGTFRLFRDCDIGLNLKEDWIIDAYQDDDMMTDSEVMDAGRNQCFKDLFSLKKGLDRFGDQV
jgi:hypothetical protein